MEIEGIAPGDLVSWLWSEHRILATPITHDEFQGVRVSPSVYTTLEELDRFADVMETAIRGRAAGVADPGASDPERLARRC